MLRFNWFLQSFHTAKIKKVRILGDRNESWQVKFEAVTRLGKNLRWWDRTLLSMKSSVPLLTQSRTSWGQLWFGCRGVLSFLSRCMWDLGQIPVLTSWGLYLDGAEDAVGRGEKAKWKQPGSVFLRGKKVLKPERGYLGGRTCKGVESQVVELKQQTGGAVQEDG